MTSITSSLVLLLLLVCKPYLAHCTKLVNMGPVARPILVERHQQPGNHGDEELPPRTFPGGVEFRTLRKDVRSLQQCQCVSPENRYGGSCGKFAQREESKWCATDVGDICCAEDEINCCTYSGSGIFLSFFLSLVFVALVTLASCACCVCCPYYEYLCCSQNYPARF